MISAESLSRLYRPGAAPAPTPDAWLAIVACMDHRLTPETRLGLRRGDAYVIRNAGGRVTDDVVRSLIVATHVLGVNECVVIHHTDCRMMHLSEARVRSDVEQRLHLDASELELLAFTDLDDCVHADVTALRMSPWLAADLPVAGFVADIEHGTFELVVDEPLSRLPICHDKKGLT
jgi:carbonic anhydrase